MAQRFRARVALVEDTGWVPSTRIAAYRHLGLQFQGIWHRLLTLGDTSHPYGAHTYVQKKILIHIKTLKKKKKKKKKPPNQPQVGG